MKDWDKLFQSAVADLEGYRISLTGDDYLTLAFHRGRCLEALEQMPECPPEYRVYGDEFKIVFHKLEEDFARYEAPIEPALDELAATDNMLEDLRDYYENTILSGGGRNELAIRASEFLEVFSRLCYLPDVVPRCRTGFLELDGKFHRLFYLFSGLTDILAAFKEDSIVPGKYWWLCEVPPLASAGDVVLYQAAQKVFDAIKAETACPTEEELAAYAFGEQRPSVEAHLFACPVCLEEVITLRHVRASISAQPMPSHIVEKILKLTEPKRSKMAEFFDWALKVQGRLPDAVAEVLSTMFPGPVERPYVFATRGDRDAIDIRLPKWVWYISRRSVPSISLIDMTQEDVRELAEALNDVNFYYILFGAVRDTAGWLDIVSTPEPARGIPFSLTTTDLKGSIILYMFIDIDKKVLVELAGSIAASSLPNKTTFTANDPLAAIVVALI